MKINAARSQKGSLFSAPLRTCPRSIPPRRHGTLRNDAAVCIGVDGGGAATAAAGVDSAEAADRLTLMESDRNFKIKYQTMIKKLNDGLTLRRFCGKGDELAASRRW